VLDSGGATVSNLACHGLYLGGGGTALPLPITFPDTSEAIGKVGACLDTRLGVVAATSFDTGSIRNCTAAGCLFGPPTPFPNPGTPPISVCLLFSLSEDLIGTTDCLTGEANIDLPLTAEIFLGGDLLPGRSGIQPCPICDSGTMTCDGGPNHGASCTPGSSALNPSYPTSHDCPPDGGQSIGDIFLTRIAIDTGTFESTARPSGTQSRVFCGYCRDADVTGCFEGDPGCLGGSGIPRRCLTDADCAQPAELCEQRTNGAFGTGLSHTITVTGSPAGALIDLQPHPMILAAQFCVQPTFNGVVDAAGDFPGPGTLTLKGTARLNAP
jgi:hypothetical protein